MALTQDEVKRWSAKFDGHSVLDPDLKPEILKNHLKECVGKIETKLKRAKGKVVLFFGEMK